MFFVGEGFDPTALNRTETLEFLLFLGACASLLAAWRWEGWGGAATIGFIVAFYVVELATSGQFPEGWAFLAIAAPGMLFLISRWAGRGVPPER